MRALWLVGFGALFGVVGTVLFIAAEPALPGGEGDAWGGGNASVTLSEEALAVLVRREIAESGLLPESTSVDVAVRDDGLLELRLGLGASTFRFQGWMRLDPSIADGRLEMRVVDTFLGDLVAAGVVQRLIEEPLQRRMESVAGGLGYRLTGIRTDDRKLTMEILIEG